MLPILNSQANLGNWLNSVTGNTNGSLPLGSLPLPPNFTPHGFPLSMPMRPKASPVAPVAPSPLNLSNPLLSTLLLAQNVALQQQQLQQLQRQQQFSAQQQQQQQQQHQQQQFSAQQQLSALAGWSNALPMQAAQSLGSLPVCPSLPRTTTTQAATPPRAATISLPVMKTAEDNSVSLPTAKTLLIKCPAIHSLQRNVPVVLTITNFWDFYQGTEDHVWILLPVELCRGEEDRRPKVRQEAPAESDFRNALRASFEVAIPQKGKKGFDGSGEGEREVLPDRTVPQESLPSVFILRKHDPWIRLKRGCQLQLRLYFYRLPSDFDADKRRPQVAREFHFTINLQAVSSPEMFASATLPLRSKARQKKNKPEVIGSSHPTAESMFTEQALSGRATAKRTLLEDVPVVIKKLRKSPEPHASLPASPSYALPTPRSPWEEIFRLAGVDPATALLYAAKCEKEKIEVDQWPRITDEALRAAGFAIGDIIRIGQHLNARQQSSSSQPQAQFPPQLQVQPPAANGEVKRKTEEEAETAKQLLLLGGLFASPKKDIVEALRAKGLELSQAVQQDAKDPETEARQRFELATSILDLLEKYLTLSGMKAMSLEEIRQATDERALGNSSSAPNDFPLSYYVGVFKAHLSARGVVRSEHYFLTETDAAKALGLSIEKATREFQSGYTLNCWMLQITLHTRCGMAWPNKPLSLLLRHIVQRIAADNGVSETTSLPVKADAGSPARSASPSKESPQPRSPFSAAGASLQQVSLPSWQIETSNVQSLPATVMFLNGQGGDRKNGIPLPSFGSTAGSSIPAFLNLPAASTAGSSSESKSSSTPPPVTSAPADMAPFIQLPPLNSPLVVD